MLFFVFSVWELGISEDSNTAISFTWQPCWGDPVHLSQCLSRPEMLVCKWQGQWGGSRNHHTTKWQCWNALLIVTLFLTHMLSPYETQMFVPVWSSPCVYFWSSWVLDRQQQMPAWDHTGAPTAHSLHLEAYLTSLQTSFTSTPSVWCIEPLVSVHVSMLRESIYSPGSQTLQHRTKLLFTFLRCLFPFDSTGLMRWS